MVAQNSVFRAPSGFSVFLTGLPSAGKTTIGRILQGRLAAFDGMAVTFLDGDILRKELSPQLGFTRQDRDSNVRRVGLMASEITKRGGIAICALIAPFDQARREVRSLVEAAGPFVLVHVSTPLAICELRDNKGLYARARAGLIQNFTGISQPYEIPQDAEVSIDGGTVSPDEAANHIYSYLFMRGLLRCGCRSQR